VIQDALERAGELPALGLRDLDSFDFRESLASKTQIRQLHTGE
jgi:hypothetical protein